MVPLPEEETCVPLLYATVRGLWRPRVTLAGPGVSCRRMCVQAESMRAAELALAVGDGDKGAF